jgi:Cryptococcal mannosyltransferase 1
MAAHEAGIRLLDRGSSDSTGSFDADDYMYGTHDEHHKPRIARSQVLRRLALAVLFLHLLSRRPLGWRKRRKGVGHASPLVRLLICVYNAVIILLALFAVRTVLGGIFLPSYWSLPPHYIEFERRLHEGPSSGKGNPLGQKIFIASNIIQPEKIRGAWGQSLLRLIDYLGPENVFVSIYENDSGPEAPKALAWLRSQLLCEPRALQINDRADL